MGPSDLQAVLAIEMEANRMPWKGGDFAPFLSDHYAAVSGEAPPENDEAPAPGVVRKGWVWARPEVKGFACAVGIADEVELQTIAVSKADWHRGIGSALMESLFRWARGGGYRVIHLEVRESNSRARKFYKSWGFTPVGRRPKYYQDNGEDALLLSNFLSAP